MLFGRRILLFALAFIVASLAYQFLCLPGRSAFLGLTLLGAGYELMAGCIAAILCHRYGAVRIERLLRPTLFVSIPALATMVLEPAVPQHARLFGVYAGMPAGLLFV